MLNEKYLSLCLAFIVFSQPVWSGQTEETPKGAELEESSEEPVNTNELEAKSWKGHLEKATGLEEGKLKSLLRKVIEKNEEQQRIIEDHQRSVPGDVGKGKGGKEGNYHGFGGCPDEQTSVQQHATFALLRISADDDEEIKYKILERTPERYRGVETREIEVVRWKLNGEQEIWLVETINGENNVKEEVTVKEELVEIEDDTMNAYPDEEEEEYILYGAAPRVEESTDVEKEKEYILYGAAPRVEESTDVEKEKEYILYGTAPRVEESTDMEKEKEYILYGSVPFTPEEGKTIYHDHVVLMSVLISVLLLIIIVVCIVAAIKVYWRRRKDTDEEALIGPEVTDGDGDKKQKKPQKDDVIHVEPPLQDTPDPEAPLKQPDESKPESDDKAPDVKEPPDAPSPEEPKPPELEMPSPGLFVSSGFTPPPVMPFLTGESETESDELSRFIGIIFDGQLTKLTSEIPLSKDSVPEICSRLLSRAGITG